MFEKFSDSKETLGEIYAKVKPEDIISEVEWALKPEINDGRFHPPKGQDKISYWLSEEVFNYALTFITLKIMALRSLATEDRLAKNDSRRARLNITLGVFMILHNEMELN